MIGPPWYNIVTIILLLSSARGSRLKRVGTYDGVRLPTDARPTTTILLYTRRDDDDDNDDPRCWLTTAARTDSARLVRPPTSGLFRQPRLRYTVHARATIADDNIILQVGRNGTAAEHRRRHATRVRRPSSLGECGMKGCRRREEQPPPPRNQIYLFCNYLFIYLFL